MAYISPNSDVVILRRVPIDSTYTHTGLFESASDQLTAFGSYQKYTLTAQSYQRVNKNRIRVALLADNLYDCNYMMFRNTAYGDKMFYAFIDAIDYVNDNCCEISYTIDVMQTWWFNWSFPECFVEREHSITDVAGDNIVPENLNIGESYVMTADANFNDDYMFAYVMTSKPIEIDIPVRLFDSTYHYHVTTTFNPTNSNMPSGIPCGGYIYAGFPVSNQDALDMLTNTSNYQMQNPRIYDSSQQYDATTTRIYPFTAPRLVSLISSGAVHSGDGSLVSTEDIMYIGLYPHTLNFNTYLDNAANAGFNEATAMTGVTGIIRPTVFVDDRDTSIRYTPKNNKLFTYPYIRLLGTNHSGSSTEYKFEDFVNGFPQFSWVGTYTNNPTMLLFPKLYKGITNNYLEGITLANFPNMQYIGSRLTSWIENNKASFATSIVASSVSNLAVSATRPSLPAAVGGVVGVGATVANAVAKVEDMKNASPSVYGQIADDVLNIAIHRPKFTVYTETIKPDYAKIIDEYFTMYGYATNRVKTPNVRSSHKRQNWNYVKTRGAIIKPLNLTNTGGMPADDAKKIAQIFDNGITFWSDMANIGGYWMSNPII